MKTCEKCKKKFSKQTRFCSLSCANSRVWSEETQRKRSESNSKAGKEVWAKIPSQDRAEKLRYLHGESRVYKTPMQDLVGSYISGKTPWKILSGQARRLVVLREQHFKCLKCGISDWLGQKLVLELDHIDGVKSNNKRKNLRGLCPNCHSQTPTFRGRNAKSPRSVAHIKAITSSRALNIKKRASRKS